MLSKVKSRFSGKYVILLFLTLLIFTKTFAAEYTVPRAAYSVYAGDLNLNGDKDIVVGHKYNTQTDWGGVSILENISNGLFILTDSLFFTNGFAYVNGNYFDNDYYIDLLSQYVSNEPVPNNNRYISIIYNYGYESFNNICYFPLDTREAVPFNSLGDIDNDNNIDIIVASSSGQFWGVLYNNGLGQFSLPEYHYVTGLHPTDIACGNLNEDDREDIVISGQEVQIYFSYESGFECCSFGDHELRIEIADMDSDGDNDIVGLTQIFDIIALTIYENLGDHNFYEHDQVIYEINTPYFKISDFNNDNLPDIVCSGTLGVYILFNEGGFNFTEPQYFQTNTSGLSRPPFCADLDGNGYNDIITIRFAYPGILTILFNDGNGNFVEEPQVGVNDNCILNIEDCELSNYPNPFNPTTNICFQLSETDKINLSIYNIKGRLIKRLINQKMKGGEHNVIWNGKDGNNKCCSSGIYLMNLKLNGKSRKTSKLILLK